MTKDEMRAGFAQGRALTQEEWSTVEEIRAVDELAAEGVCTVTPWAYRDGSQCEMRKATGIRETRSGGVMNAVINLYARAGEEIVCEAGHVVTRPTRDLSRMEVIHGYMLEGFDHLSSGDPARGIEGDVFPPCACGERWYWHGVFRFREGYRVFVNGVRTHLTLEQVSTGWPTGIEGQDIQRGRA